MEKTQKTNAVSAAVYGTPLAQVGRSVILPIVPMSAAPPAVQH